MKNWEIVKDFQLKFPNLVIDLENNTHHWSREKLNFFHLEGNSWSHVIGVLLMAQTFGANKLTFLAALGHDLGKPICTIKDEENQKIKMYGHESVSLFLMLDYLNTLDLTPAEKVRVCQLICFHTYLYQEMRKPGYELGVAQFFAGEQDLFLDLISLTRADALGRFAENENREIWVKAEETFAPVYNKIAPKVYPRQNTKGEAIVLIGPPMSGKSTWVKHNAANHLLVCRDQVIMDLGKGKKYNDAFHSVDQDEVNRQYDMFRKESIKTKKDLVFDLTHMTEKSRRKSLAGLPRDVKRVAVVFLTGYQTLVKRNEARAQSENKRIPDYVLLNMMGSFSMPLMSEGFDEIRYVFESDQV